MEEWIEYRWIIQWDKDGKAPSVTLQLPPSETAQAKEYESRGYTVFMTYRKINREQS